MPAVPSGPVTPADVAAFFHTVRTYSYAGKSIVKESWILKTANDSAVCYIDVANCGFNCDVCLTAGMFLPPVRPGMNNEYSVKERAQMQTWFEQDILLKVADEVRAARLLVQWPIPRPPSTGITAPEMYPASSLASQVTARATSNGVAKRPTGMLRL